MSFPCIEEDQLEELIAMHMQYDDAGHDGTWQQRELRAFQQLKWIRGFPDMVGGRTLTEHNHMLRNIFYKEACMNVFAWIKHAGLRGGLMELANSFPGEPDSKWFKEHADELFGGGAQ